ncbi:hypothetical protein L3Q72_06760 [Vibrio sp. JC009]|uniref:hypothetical protein n=1 Tax=Vibrio sp. JC009 TaxID=2912314 RepID=UPI0023B14089|nr:hypothetical protein [Vibrio sp. JC009]WED23089.1 hypothetical protein L3Q72_06760 [Vibrio sp. JC009]
MIKLVGKNAEMIHENLKSWQLTDGNGTEGDSLVLALSSEGINDLPDKGEKYEVYLNDVFRDDFQISKRKATLTPREVRLVLSVAKFNVTDSSGFREPKSASWDNASLYQIVSDCVTEHGYSVFIHPRLEKIKIEHIDRTDESTGPFLKRLAKMYDSVAKPVNGVYVLAPKGESKSASGKPIETITLSLSENEQERKLISVDIELDGRNTFNGVRAHYVSSDDGTRHEVSVGTSSFKKIRKDCNSKSEAEQVAAAELRKLSREGRKLSISAPANARAFCEGIVVLDASFPAPFAGSSSIDSLVFNGRGRQPASMSIQATLLGD